jgi:hypothetical protein
MVKIMSVVSEEGRSVCSEEIKRKLKSKPTLPQVEVQKTSIPRIQPAPKARIGIATAGERIPIKEIQLKPTAVKTVKPILKSLEKADVKKGATIPEAVTRA